MNPPIRNVKTRLLVGLAAAMALAAVSPALADTDFGVRTGYYTENEAGFLGGEVLTSIATNWYFNPNLEVAMNGDRDVVTANGDFHYDFFQDRPYYVWAGGGPAFIHREFSDDTDDSSFGMNFLGGIGWKTSSNVHPYLQGKVTVAEDDEAVLAFGLRF